MRWLEKYSEKKDVGGNKNGEKHGVATDCGSGRVVIRGGAGREGAVPEKSLVEQGQYMLFRKTINAEYGKPWKEGDAFIGRRSLGKDGEVVLMKPVLEGALKLQLLKNMLMPIKRKLIDGWVC